MYWLGHLEMKQRRLAYKDMFEHYYTCNQVEECPWLNQLLQMMCCKINKLAQNSKFL